MNLRCSFPNRRVLPGVGVIVCLIALVGCGGGGASSGSGGGGGSTAGTLERSSPTALFVDGGLFSVNTSDSLSISYTVANNKLSGSGMFSGPGILSAMALAQLRGKRTQVALKADSVCVLSGRELRNKRTLFARKADTLESVYLKFSI